VKKKTQSVKSNPVHTLVPVKIMAGRTLRSIMRPKNRKSETDHPARGDTSGKQKRRASKKKFVVAGLSVVVLGLAAGGIVWANVDARALERYTEVTFITPTQALVFWRSEEETVGFVTYGPARFGEKTTVTQTSSEPSTIHVAIVDGISLAGVYIQKHNESDHFWIFPKNEFVKFDNSGNSYE